jgi:mono/diheme cytochrome c family protein
MRSFAVLLLLSLLFLIRCGNRETPPVANLLEGKTIYDKYCLACHQANGTGVPGMYPPLTDTNWIQGDKNRLIGILVAGLEGEIVVNNQVYRTAMPAHNYLSDNQIADVLTYIRNSFGNSASPIAPEEVQAYRKQAGDR